jgi:hypothetical protein
MRAGKISSGRYTMDLLLPVMNFKQQDAFAADGWAAGVRRHQHRASPP